MTTPASVLRLADGTHHRLDDDRILIGREPAHPIHIPVAAVSRTHAAIDREAHGFVVRDLGSRNGTFVNGERVETTGLPLRDGDEIVIGGAETLRFIDPMATPYAPAPGRLTGVWIDPDTHAVWVDAQPVEPPLSERQQALLELLVDRVGVLVTREEVIDTVWADVAAEGVSAEALDALVKRLRARLRGVQVHGDYLEVHRGRGLRLDPGGG